MKLVVNNNVTLDGVMQAPGGAEEDTRGGFVHGGWATKPNQDPEIMEAMSSGFQDPGPLLFGRRTYEQFHSYWPHQTGNPFTEVLNNATKYVASRTLSEPLPWQNSVLLEGEAVDAVARLKEESERDFVVLGSGELVRSLLGAGLVDRLVLLIHPVVLGSGHRMFPQEGTRTDFRLVDTVTAARSGVVIATYESS